MSPIFSANEYTGIKAIAAGWGSIGEQKNHSCYLLEVELPVISNQECRDTKYETAMIADNMLCAGYPAEGNRDTCQVLKILTPALLAIALDKN